jgi:3-methyladenine DNA glycosylase AlkC
MEPFKNKYNKALVSLIADEIQVAFSEFDKKSFVKNTSKGLDKLEMKARVDQISNNLTTFLPSSFIQSSRIIKKVLHQKNLTEFSLWPFSVFVEVNGINDFKRSMDLLKEITILFTSEFGVRPFYEKYPNETLEYFTNNITHKNEHVRRWVSEGSRPNLPWGKSVSHIPKNLKSHVKMLSSLKDDNSLYVRKSVANHMNDITWLDPELAITTLKAWNKSPSEELSWVIRHALRNLLKKGHPGALQLLGFNPESRVKVRNFSIDKKNVKEGDYFYLSIDIISENKHESKLMVDYNIYYPKSNGHLSKKTFKGKNSSLANSEQLSFSKKVSFKKVTTRTHHKGLHYIELQINGKPLNKLSFNLV